MDWVGICRLASCACGRRSTHRRRQWGRSYCACRPRGRSRRDQIRLDLPLLWHKTFKYSQIRPYSGTNLNTLNQDVKTPRGGWVRSSWRRKQFNCQFRVAENFQIILKGLDVISLLVKYYVPLAHINKVVKLLKFKFEVFLIWGAIGRGFSIEPPIRNIANSLQVKTLKAL